MGHQSTHEWPLVTQEGQRPAEVLGATPPSLPAGEGQDSTANQMGGEGAGKMGDRYPGPQPKSPSPKTGGESCRLPAHLLPGSTCAHLPPRYQVCSPASPSLEARHPNRVLGGRLASDGLASGHAYIHSYLKIKKRHLKHSGQYHLWAHRAQCYPSNNSPKCSVS